MIKFGVIFWLVCVYTFFYTLFKASSAKTAWERRLDDDDQMRWSREPKWKHEL
jgi:hypothetical protein